MLDFILPQFVVINEINYHSSDDFNTEDWVELYNNSEDTFDLSNWSIMDVNDNIFVISESTLIDPNSYIVFSQDIDSFNLFYPEVENVIGNLGFGFSSSGDSLRLFNSENELMDLVEYDDEIPWPTEPDGNGPTLELIDPFSDNNLAENWEASEGYGTPGSINSNNLLIENPFSQPNKLNIFNNYPNPFNPSTTISFFIAEKLYTSIKIYDIKGNLISIILNQPMNPGYHSIPWNAESLNSGIYFLVLNAGDYSEKQKLILLK